MATERIVHVDTMNVGSPEYTSLSAAEDGEDATGGLVVRDEFIRFICSADDAGATHTADTTAVTIAGWTTDATRYIQIEAASSHGGKWNDNIYRLTVTNAIAVGLEETEVRFIGIQFKITADGATAYSGIDYTTTGITGNVYVNKCIFIGVLSSTNNSRGINVALAGITWRVTNCIAYDFVNSGTGSNGFKVFTGTLNIYNSTTHNCYFGFRQTSGTANAYNCGAAASTSAGFSGTWTTTTCSSTTPTFVDEAGDDFHLAAGDTTWKNLGTDYSGTFTDDIDGQTRPTGAGTWDIGADEYVAAAGTVIPVFMHHYQHAMGRR
jgi:hypothetical protein